MHIWVLFFNSTLKLLTFFFFFLLLKNLWYIFRANKFQRTLFHIMGRARTYLIMTEYFQFFFPSLKTMLSFISIIHKLQLLNILLVWLFWTCCYLLGQLRSKNKRFYFVFIYFFSNTLPSFQIYVSFWPIQFSFSL